jgi:guanidinoacetate N-methyltransferase
MFETDDPRNATREARMIIGFAPSWRAWSDSPAIFRDGTLMIQGHPVMEDWEAPYMEQLAAIACSNDGRVLEVGFGLGLSAGYVQSFPIKEHVIIEANRQVFQRVLHFGQHAQRKVTPYFGFWQDVVTRLTPGSFDGILFDTYPLQAAEIHTNHLPFLEYAYRLLRSGGVLTYYSDEISELSSSHRHALQAVGFHDISYTVCSVTPPDSCTYWTSSTIVAPIIYKP